MTVKNLLTNLARYAGRVAYGTVHPVFPAAWQRQMEPHLAWAKEDLSSLPTVDPKADVRLLIAPANYAGQGAAWAKAAQTLPGVSATNMQFRSGAKFAYPAGTTVSAEMAASSLLWSSRMRRQLKEGFTHFLWEASIPLTTALSGGRIHTEVERVMKTSLRVGFIGHGNDIRLPSAHADLIADSPFKDTSDQLTRILEAEASRNLSIWNAVDVPKFVSTPDLLYYAPDATWLPITVDLSEWKALPRREFPRRPTVLHVPTNPKLKGTLQIRAVMEELESRGLIAYREVMGLTRQQMLSAVAKADIVVDQISMGAYGVATLEALAAGKIAVAQIGEWTRGEIGRRTGKECPIVEANASTLEEAIVRVVEDKAFRDEFLQAAPAFLEHVHGDSAVAAALSPFLLGAPVN